MPRPAMAIGLASGSVVGGVIGQRRILYDLWGRCGKHRSRMDSSGFRADPGGTVDTRFFLRDSWSFEERER